jgi:hypothetical protein
MANEKLKELYKQARGLRMSLNDFALEAWEKKFAELIVQECATVMNKTILKVAASEIPFLNTLGLGNKMFGFKQINWYVVALCIVIGFIVGYVIPLIYHP